MNQKKKRHECLILMLNLKVSTQKRSEASKNKATIKTVMEKFNYLRCFLEGDAPHVIAGFSLTNDNYKENT